jgi:hypothetical protein
MVVDTNRFADARKWFTGPKITIGAEDMTAEQEAAIRDGSLQIEGVSTDRNGSEEGYGVEKAASTTKV